MFLLADKTNERLMGVALGVAECSEKSFKKKAQRAG